MAGVDEVTSQVPVDNQNKNGKIITVQIAEDVVIQKQYVKHQKKTEVSQKYQGPITQFSF